jgi:hypothetical protein
MPGAAFEYLWNGKNLWKRSGEPVTPQASLECGPAEQLGLSEEEFSRLMGRC